MKHYTTMLTLLIVTLLIPYYTTAQQYQPLPDSNASWIIEHNDGYGGSYFERFILSPGLDDTVINSINYTKIYYQLLDNDPDYYGAFRNAENGKSYFIKRFTNDDHLLRDFSKNTGDTIYDVDYEEGLLDQWILDFIVDSTDFKVSGPYTYKIMYLNTVVEDTIPEQGNYPLVWIEKIGCFAGGIVNSFRGGLNAIKLYCMQYNDTIYYNNPYYWSFQKTEIMYQNGQCIYPVGIENSSKDTGIKISPNPFTNRLTIRNLPDVDEIEIKIINILGQVEYSKRLINFRQPNTTINTEKLNTGIHLLKIISNNKLLLTQKIIKK